MAPSVATAAVELLVELEDGIAVVPAAVALVAAAPRWMRPITQIIKMAIVLLSNILNFLMRLTPLILIE